MPRLYVGPERDQMGLGPLHYMVITFDGHRVMSEVTSVTRSRRTPQSTVPDAS